MKIKIVPQVGCAYSVQDGNVFYVPLNKDWTFDTEDGEEVDRELIGDELLPEPVGSARTYGELYDRLLIELA